MKLQRPIFLLIIFFLLTCAYLLIIKGVSLTFFEAAIFVVLAILTTVDFPRLSVVQIIVSCLGILGGFLYVLIELVPMVFPNDSNTSFLLKLEFGFLISSVLLVISAGILSFFYALLTGQARIRFQSRNYWHY